MRVWARGRASRRHESSCPSACSACTVGAGEGQVLTLTCTRCWVEVNNRKKPGKRQGPQRRSIMAHGMAHGMAKLSLPSARDPHVCLRLGPRTSSCYYQSLPPVLPAAAPHSGHHATAGLSATTLHLHALHTGSAGPSRPGLRTGPRWPLRRRRPATRSRRPLAALPCMAESLSGGPWGMSWCRGVRGYIRERLSTCGDLSA